MEGRVRGSDSGDTNVEYANKKVNVRSKTLLAYGNDATAVTPNPNPNSKPSSKSYFQARVKTWTRVRGNGCSITTICQ